MAEIENEDTPRFYHNFNLSTFIITYKCPISCPMCFFAAGPNRKEMLPEFVALKVLEESKKLHIPAIGIAGGEPFLYMDLMSKLIKEAAQSDMTIIVVTNAFWAASEETATQKLRYLKELGLKRIQFSLDDHHQRFIPLENVANALKAAVKLEYDDIKLLGASIGNTGKFKYQLFYLKEILGVDISSIDLIDRARTSHRYYFDEDQERYSFEELEHSDTNDLPVKKPGDCLSEMMLDVNGDIYPCCNNFVGIIGNTYTDNLDEILGKLHLNRYFRILKKEGPFALARYLDRTQGTNFVDKRYGNWCELCADIFQNNQFSKLLLPNISDQEKCPTDIH
jgi:MoaA/NifB/PqqE/SkfB family radical SAM enzyme